MKHRRSALAACVVAFAMTTVAAQTGGIDVVVTDAEGSPLPGATVTISHDAGYVKTMAELTDANGIVRFPVLRAGSGYAVQVSFPGFNAIRQTDLRVRINSTLVVKTQMIEEFEERVRVAAEREAIDLDEIERYRSSASGGASAFSSRRRSSTRSTTRRTSSTTRSSNAASSSTARTRRPAVSGDSGRSV